MYKTIKEEPQPNRENAEANSNRKSFRLQNYKIQILKNSDAKEKQLWNITDKKTLKKKKCYAEKNFKKIEEKAY